MPLQRRVPKRGFTNIFRVPYQIVNLDDLERIKGDEVNKEILKEVRLIRSTNKPVKLLGNGTIQKIYNVTIEAFSVSAREAIEAAGGTCVTTELPKQKRKPVRKKKSSTAAAVTEPAPEAADDTVTESDVITEEETVVEEAATVEEVTPVEEVEVSEVVEPEVAEEEREPEENKVEESESEGSEPEEEA
jgi:ribosomal protein L18E